MRPPRLAPASAALAVALALAACGAYTGAEEQDSPAAGTSASSRPGEPTPTPSATTTEEPASSAPATPQDAATMVAGADALRDVRVTRAGATYDVTSLWGVSCDHSGCEPTVLARSDDGFETATYRVGGYGQLSRELAPPRPPGAPRLAGCSTSVDGVTLCAGVGGITRTADGGTTWTPLADPFDRPLMIQPVVSLRPGVQALVGGGDGATLFPFDQVARLEDRRDPVVAEFGGGGELAAYTTGQVVLSDGRFLALLDAWSDDRAGRPSARHHGLWLSAADWGAYQPHEPVFTPPLPAATDGYSPFQQLAASAEPDPVIWVRTRDDQVYVSTDDAATFTLLPVRPRSPA
ncbi:hypothetical protein [Nocardioides solisilvae]|uniref:hypothetical protein n=1 Tax=Nocardioides solisilvae TaxID=1542435 RepID=UPI0013A5A4A1|nr:hypothetical protein [Nocardioides solisilvae]